MQDEKNRVVIEVMGHQYTVVGRETEEHLHSIALYVDKKIKELHKKGRTMNYTMLAVLAALNITDELFKIKQELEVLRKQAAKPGKELEDIRYQLRKSKEEHGKLKTETRNLKQQLNNSQEEASNIYSEWLKAQRDLKNARYSIEKLEEQKRELEIQMEGIKHYKQRLGSDGGP